MSGGRRCWRVLQVYGIKLGVLLREDSALGDEGLEVLRSFESWTLSSNEHLGGEKMGMSWGTDLYSGTTHATRRRKTENLGLWL